MAMAGGQNINDLPEALIKIKKLLNSWAWLYKNTVVLQLPILKE
jgi:hypothetical protein